MRKTGQVPAQLQAVRLLGSPIGVHAAAKDGTTSLCGRPSRRPARAATVEATGTAAKVAHVVTCRFCQVRLVGAGVLDPKAESVSAYARDYGTRDTEAELAKLAPKAESKTTSTKSTTSKRVKATA